MSDREKSSRAALLVIGGFLLFVVLVCVFISRQVNTDTRENEPVAQSTPGRNGSGDVGKGDAERPAARTLEEALDP
jgi:hypothetical protein